MSSPAKPRPAAEIPVVRGSLRALQAFLDEQTKVELDPEEERILDEVVAALTGGNPVRFFKVGK